MTSSKPPRLARELLTWLIPYESQGEILGDLEEEFHARPGVAGRFWYWRQALRFSAFLLVDAVVQPAKRAAATLLAPGGTSVRQTIRALAKTPGFSIVVITIMALGIGLNTAVFSLIYGILLRPFPYRDPERLVRVESMNVRTGHITQNSWPDLEDWRSYSRTFEDLALYIAFQTDLRTDGPAESVRMAWITPELFPVLGIDPVMGRRLRPEEGRLGGDVHKALISHHLWQTMFGSDPDILNRPLRIPQATYTVVGVMPPGFRFPDAADLWIPLASGVSVAPTFDPDQVRASRGWRVVGRLRPGVTIAQAAADLRRVGDGLERDHPVVNRNIRPVVSDWRDGEVATLRPYLLLLFGGVSLLLMLCCVNVAALFLAWRTARAREISIRVALGAGQGVLIRQLLIEGLVLSTCGSIAGIGVASVALRALMSLVPMTLPFWMRIELDLQVLQYTAAVSVATGILFGLAPAWGSRRADFSASLRGGPNVSGSVQAERVRSALVVLEVGFSVVLVATAGLLIRSFMNLQHAESGFQPQGLVTAQVSPFRPGSRAEKLAAYSSLYARIVEELRTVPGVIAASAVDPMPFRPNAADRRNVEVMVGVPGAERIANVTATTASISPAYLRTMKIRLLTGREFGEHDAADGEPVVIVSERAAAMLFASPAGAIDRAIRLHTGPLTAAWHRIVGVAANVRYAADDAPAGVEFYFPMSQRAPGASDFVVRVEGDPAALVPAVRHAISRVDRGTAVVHVRTVESLMDDSLWQQRLSGFLLSAFAAVSLAIAAFGLFEVLSYLVSLRTREIGIRMALGAQPLAIFQLVISRCAVLTGIGLGLGLLLALLAGRGMGALLFGVSAVDPSVLVAVAIVFVAVAALACLVPVWRAAHVDPLVTLRQE